MDGATYDTENNPIKHPYLSNIHKTRKEIDKAGIVCMHGTWTKEEIDTLDRNIEKYQTEHKIKDFGEYLRNVVIPNRQIVEISRQLSKNIIRRLESVYKRIYYQFASNNIKLGSSLSKDEINQISVLQKLHGNKWKLIGKVMGRSQKDLCTYFHNRNSPHHRKGIFQICSTKKRTTFLPSEYEKLINIIQTQASVETGKINDSKINWVSVAREFGTRNAVTCQRRWSTVLSTRIKSGITEKDQRSMYQDLKKKILKLFIDEQIEDKNDIDWKKVVEYLGENVNPSELRRRFLRFLERQTGKRTKKTFRESLLDKWCEVNL